MKNSYSLPLRIVLVMILSCCASAMLRAALITPLQLSLLQDNSEVLINHYVQWYADPAAELSPALLDSIQMSGVSGQRLPNHTGILQSQGYWGYFELNNNQKEYEEVVLQFDDYFFFSTEVYVKSPDYYYEKYQVGSSVPFSQKQFQDGYESFIRIKASPQSKTKVFFKFNSGHGLPHEVSKIKVLSSQSWQAKRVSAHITNIIYMMIPFVFMLINLLLYINTGQKEFLWYSLYTGCLLAYFTLWAGYAHDYLFPEQPDLFHYLVFCFHLSFLAYVQFIKVVLKVPGISTRWSKIINGYSVFLIGYVCLQLALTASVIQLRYVLIVEFSMVFIHLLFVVYNLIQCFRTSNVIAKLIGFSFLGPMVVLLFFWAGDLDLIPHDWYDARFFFLLESIFAVIALATGYRAEKLQKIEVQNELITQLARNEKILNNQKSLLEQEVETQTREIRKQKEQLEADSEVKSKFLSIISHDLRGPLSNLDAILSMYREEMLTREELISLSHKIDDRVQTMVRLLDNLVIWARNQTHGIKPEAQAVSVSDTVREICKLYQAQAQGKGVVLQEKIGTHVIAQADPNMLELVIRNLVSNAIKFTQKGDRITIMAYQQDIEVYVQVTDTGLGMPQHVADQLFGSDISISTMGTAKEKGTGLGLLLCKEFIEMNGGQITVSSVEGTGSSFTFRLPAYLAHHGGKTILPDISKTNKL